MNSIKKLLCLLFAAVIFSNTHAKLHESYHPRNVIEIMGTKEDSLHHGESESMLRKLIQALGVPVANIVVTGNVFHNAITNVENRYEKKIADSTKKIADCTKLITRLMTDNEKAIAVISATQEKMIAINKKVIASNAKNQTQINELECIIQQEKDQIKKNKKNIEVLQNSKKTNTKRRKKYIKLCPNHKAAIHSLFTTWKVYQACHGDYYLLIPNEAVTNTNVSGGFAINDNSVLKEISSFSQLKKSLAIWNQNNANEPPTVNCWKKLSKIYLPGSCSWIFYHTGHGTGIHFLERTKNATLTQEQTSGLKLHDALDRLQFLGTTIKTIANCESSCYGPGHSAKLALNLLKDLTSEPTFTPYIHLIRGVSDMSFMPGTINLEDFFNKLRRDHTVSDLAFYSEAGECLGNLLYTPGSETFTVLPEQNATPISCLTCDHINMPSILLLDEERVLQNIEINHEKITKLISTIPGNACHKIKSITTKLPIAKFLTDCFLRFDNGNDIRCDASRKIFFIKKLKTKSYDLKDVIIVKYSNLDEEGFVLNAKNNLAGPIQYYSGRFRCKDNRIKPSISLLKDSEKSYKKVYNKAKKELTIQREFYGNAPYRI